MVKPDVKVNYYAALELGADSSIEDIKKQYKKLALKYHPDRNPGKEEEIVPKFQAIAAAHEVLSDPTTKAKYDGDRRRANLTGAPPTRPSASGQRGNPYTATSNFAPPPRRTHDPTNWTRPPRPGATGADRFTNFPGPTPTARQTDPRTNAAKSAEAWSHLGGQKRQQTTTNPGPSPQQQRRAPPVPPRAGPAPPPRPDFAKSEEEIRAGMNYRPAPASFASHAERSAYAQTAYTHFNPANAQRPGVQRHSTTTTPRKGGFNPNTPGSDERPPAGPSNYTNLHDNVAGKPSYKDHMSQASSHSNGSTDSRPSSTSTRPNFGEANRTSSTYAHAYTRSGGEKTYFSSEQLRRSHSTRDATKLQQPGPARHRSASPTKKSTPEPTKGFSLADSDGSTSASPSSSDASPVSQKGPFGNRPRPKKIPTSRLNGANLRSSAPQSPLYGRRPSQQSQPSRKNSISAGSDQATYNNMYDPSSFSSDSSCEFKHAWYNCYPFGPHKTAPDARRGTVPQWAIPSSVNLRPSGKQDRARDAFQQDDLGYVADPPLIDVDETVHLPPHPAAKSKSSHESDMYLLAHGFDGFVPRLEKSFEHEFAGVSIDSNADLRQNSFTIPTGLDSHNNAQNRSTDEINTSFATAGHAPAFTAAPANTATASPTYPRRSSPPKRGRRPLSTRGSSSHIHSVPASQFQSPISPATVPIATGFGEQVTAGLGANFATENWADHFGANPKRRTSQSESVRETAMPHPVTVQDTSDASDERDSASQTGATSADAMDIDPTPPAQPKPARQYAIPPSSWRLSQNANQQMPQSGRRSSARSSMEMPALDEQRKGSVGSIPSLAQLSATLNQPNEAGLNDMTDFNASLPFTSRPSPAHPGKLFSPNDYSPAPLPLIPEVPDTPPKLSKSNWKEYTAKMTSYLIAWHNFQRQLADRTRGNLEMEAQLLAKGPVGLEARGETSTDISIESYLRRVTENDRWSMCAQKAQDKHLAAVQKYVHLKSKVRELADAGRLVD